jgi:hypothetical protein
MFAKTGLAVMQALNISKFGFLCFLLFFINSLIGRLLFPFGDEPDFTVRAVSLANNTEELPFWSPYNILFSFFEDIKVYPNCLINSSPFSFWSSIDKNSCSESPAQVLQRIAITLIITAPLLCLIIFRNFFLKIFTLLRYKLTIVEWKHRLDTVSISLTFPSIVYYVGLLSHEQLTLCISFFVFIFWDSIFLVFGLIVLVFSIDPGNAVIILLFLVIGKISKYLIYLQKQYLFYLFALGSLGLAYIFGLSILNILPLNYLGIEQKASALQHLFSEGVGAELQDKYPKFLRPVLTYMTFVFMTPSFVKVISAYIVFFTFFLMAAFKKNLNNFTADDKLYSERKLLVVAVVVTIMFCVFIFPTHSNAKYYIFTLPFLVSNLLSKFKKEVILSFSVLISVIIYSHLLLYRFSF